MAYEPKEGQGNLFRNRDRKSDAQPAMRGTVMVDGTLREIAAWSHEDKNGQKYLSLKVSLPREKAEKKPAQSDLW